MSGLIKKIRDSATISSAVDQDRRAGKSQRFGKGEEFQLHIRQENSDPPDNGTNYPSIVDPRRSYVIYGYYVKRKSGSFSVTAQFTSGTTPTITQSDVGEIKIFDEVLYWSAGSDATLTQVTASGLEEFQIIFLMREV